MSPLDSKWLGETVVFTNCSLGRNDGIVVQRHGKEGRSKGEEGSRRSRKEKRNKKEKEGSKKKEGREKA